VNSMPRQDQSSIARRVQELAPERRKLLDRLLKADKKAPFFAPKITPRRTSVAVPLSYGQERVWFMNELVVGNPLFNLHAGIRLGWRVEVGVVERSLNEIVRRHEALRTSFVEEGERPVQVIAGELKLAVPEVDLRGLGTEEREREAVRLAGEQWGAPFDLKRGPLLRAQLLRMEEEEYVFLLTIHHIVSDGWSMEVLLRELNWLYGWFAAGQPSRLPELGIQYGDFAVWQREYLEGERLEQELGYWKKQLQEVRDLQLPTDRVRPGAQSFMGAHYRFGLRGKLVRQLRGVSQREGVTLFMTLLGVFKGLLHRYSQQEDIVVGTYVAGRNWAEVEGLIGFFVNTVVLRTDFSGSPSWGEVLQRVRQTALEGYGHQDVPFARVVEELQPQRDLSRNPLFQVVFQMLNLPGGSKGRGARGRGGVEAERGTTVVDLTCTMRESEEGMEADFEYSTDLFERETVEGMAEHYVRLLEAMVGNIEQRVWEAPLLGEGERKKLLREWNETEVEYPQDRCVGELFAAQAEATPQAVALIYEGEEVRFQELNQEANRVAHYLRGRGLEREGRVGICLQRTPQMVAVILGVLKAGGAYVPLDPSYPRARLASMVEDAELSWVITDQESGGALGEIAMSPRTLVLEEEQEPWRGCEVSNPVSGVQAENLAYVIYTSGSTGQAKGVMGRHGGLLNRFYWMWERWPFARGEVSCQKTSESFVDSIWEMLGPLLQGIPIVMIPQGKVSHAGEMITILEQHRVSRMVVVPSLLRALLEEMEETGRRLPGLKYCFASGETLSGGLAKRFLQWQGKGTKLINLYGSSEDTGDVTAYEVSGEEGERVPIGRPIANTQVYILDEHRQPVPVGVRGEIYIGGASLARGYLKRAELTGERFVRHGVEEGGERQLYRSGDVGRYLRDGNIELLGRVDDQVKIRGFRVEPGEIAAVLRQHGEVQEAVVIARPAGGGEAQLVAYWVAKEEPGPTSVELRRWAAGKLPEYMMPWRFVQVEKMPLTPSGKIDRRGLPEPEALRPELEQTYVRPQSALQENLAQIFGDLLGVQQVGIHDNFFDLGGHSLLATQLVSRLRQKFQVEFPLRHFFEHPTVAGVEERLTVRDTPHCTMTKFENDSGYEYGEL
jgi:surfactin family lipopeptide synthetase A